MAHCHRRIVRTGYRERKAGEYRYYILNDEEINRGGLRAWLISTFTVSNQLTNHQSLKDRIILENVPSGQQFLSVVLEAMQENCVLHVTYQSYWKDDAKDFDVEPYCIKLFKQRWYMIAHNPDRDNIMIYAFDRICKIQKLEDKTFALPEDFSAEALFDGCYGIIIGDGTKLQHVKLKVGGNQAKFFRSLPLHTTQQETYVGEEYSVFEYDIRPTFDFQQEILSHIPNVEVLSPLWLRQEIAWKIEAINQKYNG